MLLNLLYIDPAATSVLLSSISAIVVALGATFIILWRKFKKKACKVLKIDENAGKEVEDELVITDENMASETSTAEKVETALDEKAETSAKTVETEPTNEK